MADDEYNSQKHRFQYIERIRKQRRRRRVWFRILVGSIQQSVQNGHVLGGLAPMLAPVGSFACQ